MGVDDSDFLVDEFRLDKEWLKQPRLARKYNKYQARFHLEHERAKSELKLVASELDTLLRKNPAKYGIVKVTDKAIENKIPTMDQYKEAQAQVHDTMYALDVARSACTAMEHKKRALEKLVDLHLSDYYAEPREPDADKDELEELKKRAARGRGRIRDRRGDDDNELGSDSDD